MDTLQFAKEVPLFNGLTEDEMSDVMKLATERSFKKGDAIFTEHSEGSKLFIVTEGSVSIQLLVIPDEDQFTISDLTQGDIFGELAIVDKGPRAASAICREDVSVLVIGKDDLEALFEENNHLGMVIYRNISMIVCERIRQTNEKLVNNITWGVI